MFHRALYYIKISSLSCVLKYAASPTTRQTRLSQGTDSTALVRRLCMGHCSTHRCSYHQLLLLIGQRYHSEYNSTLKLCRHLKAISACANCMLYCPYFIESQLLTSEVMRHNKVLLTLWAALHSTTYDKWSLRSKPLYSYTQWLVLHIWK